MRALLTGASGFIGRHLAEHLRARGWSVACCVRSLTGAPGTVHLPSLERESVRALPLDCDAVIHLAGLAHRYPPHVPPDVEYERVNGTAVGWIAEAARGRARAFVLASSVAALGTGLNAPLTPLTLPNPTTAYGRSKLLGEVLARNVLEGSQTSLRILRLPAVHGPGAPGAIGQLAMWIARGRPVPSGAAHVRRSMLFIENAVDALELAAAHPALDGVVAMPTDGPAPDVLGVCRAIAAALERPLRVFPVPQSALRVLALLARAAPGGGVPGLASIERLVASCVVEDATLERLTGWTPRVRFEEAVRRTAMGARS